MSADNLNQTATITAQDSFTAGIPVHPEDRVSISLSGISDSTVTLQRKIDGTNWRDVKTYTANAEETYVADEAGEVRAGVKTGDYGTDTVVARLGVGG